MNMVESGVQAEKGISVKVQTENKEDEFMQFVKIVSLFCCSKNIRSTIKDKKYEEMYNELLNFKQLFNEYINTPSAQDIPSIEMKKKKRRLTSRSKSSLYINRMYNKLFT